MTNTFQINRHTRLAAVCFGAIAFLSHSVVAREVPAENSAWHCSADGHEYRIDEVGGLLRIGGIRVGRIEASLPVKQKKSGKTTIMGQWQAGSHRGFIEITGMDSDRISAFMLVPQNGAEPNACLTRTLAVLTNMSASNGRLPGCRRLDVMWERQNMSVEEAFNSETAAEAQRAQQQMRVPEGLQQGGETNGGLIGTWVYEDAGSVHFTRIEITLRPDGTYTKTLGARTPGWGGGGKGIGGLGGTHQGRWTSSGMVVYLSGDGNWPQSTHDLSGFRRVR
jgi:hypothetical protein